MAFALQSCQGSQEIKKIEDFYRKSLRILQGLPESVAKESVYLLSGQLPAEALLHCRSFSLFGQIARLESDHPLKRLAARQIVIRSPKSGSWFANLFKLASCYDIDLTQALFFPWKKETWKAYCKKTVATHWEFRLRSQIIVKRSLKMILWPKFALLEPHGLWQACRGSPREARAAETRARFLTGRYTCFASAWIRRPDGSVETCKMCNRDPETLAHLMIGCKYVLHFTRPIISQLLHLFLAQNLPLPSDDAELESLILNGSSYWSDRLNLTVELRSNTPDWLQANKLANQIFHKIDYIRQTFLGDLTKI